MVNQILAYKTSHSGEASQAVGKIPQTSFGIKHKDKSLLTNSQNSPFTPTIFIVALSLVTFPLYWLLR
jgi:hypothetical protein